jgi:CO/xanthine dehydrogenase FAD-binding subunit
MLRQPVTCREAVGLLAVEGGRLLAGGTDLFPALGDRPPGLLIDLSRCADLKGIARTPTHTRIGGGVSWSEIGAAALPRGFAALQAAAREVGSVQIENRATIAGNLCNASPAADGVPPLLALDAEVELTGAAGVRRMPLAAFIIGNRRTQVRPDEVLSAVLVPHALADAGSAFCKLGSRRYLVISIVMVAATLLRGQDGRIAAARVAIGAASAVARRLERLEERLIGEAAPVPVTEDDLAALSPIDDVRATAAYRIDAAREIVGRALRDAWSAAHA